MDFIVCFMKEAPVDNSAMVRIQEIFVDKDHIIITLNPSLYEDNRIFRKFRVKQCLDFITPFLFTSKFREYVHKDKTMDKNINVVKVPNNSSLICFLEQCFLVRD